MHRPVGNPGSPTNQLLMGSTDGRWSGLQGA